MPEILSEIVTIRMEPSTRRRLEALCEQTHRSQANMVRYLILRAKETGLPEVVTEAEHSERLQTPAEDKAGVLA